MARRLVLLVVAVAAAAAAATPADAKDVEAIVIVGSDGRSAVVRAERTVLAVMLYHPASVYRVRPHRAAPRGGYVRIYPLGPGGMPAVPGRFYPATGALCFSWNQAVAPRGCGRLGKPRRLLAASRRVAAFRGRPTWIRSLEPGGTANLFAAIELAFDRYGLARPAKRPAQCLQFTAMWSGARVARRPSRLCVSRRGIFAGSRLYRAVPATWWLALQSR